MERMKWGGKGEKEVETVEVVKEIWMSELLLDRKKGICGLKI